MVDEEIKKWAENAEKGIELGKPAYIVKSDITSNSSNKRTHTSMKVIPTSHPTRLRCSMRFKGKSLPTSKFAN